MTRSIAAAALLALVPCAAYAHAHLKTAVPSADATVRVPPTEVAIDFTEGVEPRFSSIEVLDAGGMHQETGPATTAPGDNKHLSVPIKPLLPGTYTVTWHATAVDTHKTEGRYRFTVAAAGS